MNYLYGLIFMLLAIWIPWWGRYYLSSWLQKKKLRSQLVHHPQSSHLLRIESLLTKVYRGQSASHVAMKDRNKLNYHQDDFVYGEIEFLPFLLLLEKVKNKPGEIFVDFGCGSGRAVLTAALFLDLSQSVGIELLPNLCALAQKHLEKTQKLIQKAENHWAKLSLVKFIKDDFKNYNLERCDILFINATCYKGPVWENICQLLQGLKKNSRVIVTSQLLPLENFTLFYEGQTLMSWGMNSVRIYIRN